MAHGLISSQRRVWTRFRGSIRIRLRECGDKGNRTAVRCPRRYVALAGVGAEMKEPPSGRGRLFRQRGFAAGDVISLHLRLVTDLTVVSDLECTGLGPA